MTAQQVKNLNDLMTDTMVNGFSTEIMIIRKPKRVSFEARMRSNLEKKAYIHKAFKGNTPLEAYSKLADAMALEREE